MKLFYLFIVFSSSVLFAKPVPVTDINVRGNGEAVYTTSDGKVSTGSVFAYAGYVGTANCGWASTNSVFSPPPQDPDCPAISVRSIRGCSVDTRIPAGGTRPEIRFTYLPAGAYKITATFQFVIGSFNQWYFYGIDAGDLKVEYNWAYRSSANASDSATLVKVYEHKGGPVTFRVLQASEGPSSSTIENTVLDGDTRAGLHWEVVRI
jgi:hypothetical protein